MKISEKQTLRKIAVLTLSAGLLGGLGACATTSTVKVSQAAPVTYKIGEHGTSYASLRLPQSSSSQGSALPRTAPSPLATPRPVPVQPQASMPRTSTVPDLANIDRHLYPHMKVGNSYKVAGKTYHPKHNPDYDNIGVASWYGDKFHGKPTANGEVYDKYAMTAAHKTLPLNSYVYVTNLDTGKSIKVRLNDRGPFIDGRIIDLSQAAAETLGIQGKGLGRVRVQYAGPAKAGDAGKMFTPQQPIQQAERETAPLPAPVPVVPAPIRPVTPEVKAPQPLPKAQTELQPYSPLRDLGDAPRYVTSPDQNTYTVPNISGAPSGGMIALPGSGMSRSAETLPPIPQPVDDGSVDDSVTTLTIKGPIHMARSEGSIRDRAEYIPANYRPEK